MIPLGMWFTRGPLGTPSPVAVGGAQWVWPLDATAMRIFQMRCRGNYFVEFGHSENDDPNLDTRDLP